MKVTILKGLPASGKSTKAKELVEASGGKTKRINKDDLRAMLDSERFSKEREQYVVRVRDTLLAQALQERYDVIIDDTNLHEKHEKRIREIAAAVGADVEVDDSFLKVPVKECIRRDALRANPVGKKVITRMARDNGLGRVEPYFVEGLPDAVICDLDGTLALMNGRNPFDASTCEDDEVNGPVAHYLRFLATQFPVFYFSGREDQYREPTLKWLTRWGLNFHQELSMRPTGNYEKDVIIKGRMFERHIRGRYNVHVVLDDRGQVVEGWRALGLNCFQVAEGDF